MYSSAYHNQMKYIKGTNANCKANVVILKRLILKILKQKFKLNPILFLK